MTRVLRLLASREHIDKAASMEFNTQQFSIKNPFRREPGNSAPVRYNLEAIFTRQRDNAGRTLQITGDFASGGVEDLACVRMVVVV